MKKIIKNELSGWKSCEVIWLLLACSIIAGLSIYWGDNLMGIISATTGVACVVCTGKGKLSAYLFGLVNCVLYAIISYRAGYYGEVSFNVVSIPLQFVGFFTWLKHMDSETHEVKKRRMTNKGRLFLVSMIIICTLLYGNLLNMINGNMPFIDSFTTVASMIAMIISVMMYSEQWYMWLVVNSVSIVLWVVNLMNGTDNWATLLMWLVFWINSVINLIKWEKEAKGK